MKCMCNRSDVDFGEESEYKRISLWLVLSFFTFMNSYQLTYIHTWQYYVSLQLSPYECTPAIRITGFVTGFDPEGEAQVRLRHVQGYLYLLQLRAPLPQVCINQWVYVCVYVCMYVCSNCALGKMIAYYRANVYIFRFHEVVYSLRNPAEEILSVRICTYCT